MNETLLKYQRLERCARTAAIMVRYLAAHDGPTGRPLTEREKWEERYHLDNAHRFVILMAVCR